MAEARVLLIDENEEDVRLVREAIRAYPSVLTFHTAATLPEGFRLLESRRFDAVLVDLSLTGSQGLETLRRVRLAAPELPIIVLMGGHDTELALQAVRNGAQDYLPKGAFDGMLLIRTVRHAIERMHALRGLLESEERYRTLYERVDAGILELDASGKLISANPALVEMLEHRGLSDVLALRLDSEIFCDPEEFRSWFAAARQGGRHRAAKLRLRSAAGREVVALASMHELRSRDGVLLGYQALLTEASRLSARLSYEASHDSITELLNRPMFEAVCRETFDLERHVRWAFFYIDLDRFKRVNDTVGHFAGDELLKGVAGAIRTCVTSTDIVARLGGDEFGCLFRAQDDEQASAAAARILTAIEGVRLRWGSQILTTTASIGMIINRAKHTDPEQLIASAVSACHTAKVLGGNRVFNGQYDSDSLNQEAREKRWAIRIKAAMSENRLLLYYRPVVAVRDPDGPWAFVELLLRKVGGEGRVHTPAEFFRAVERYKFAAAIDRWVINSALVWMKENLERLRSMVCAINLSEQSIGEPTFLGYIQQRLDTVGVPANMLCFEVAESVAVRLLSATQRFMSQLRERGCRFSLDGFGSGLSSFGCLRNIDVDYIKLDALSVNAVCNDSVSRAMVRSFADVARAMGKQTIAEGVQSAAAIDVLLELGVDYVQGSGVGMPAPLNTFLTPTTSRGAGNRARGSNGCVGAPPVERAPKRTVS